MKAMHALFAAILYLCLLRNTYLVDALFTVGRREKYWSISIAYGTKAK